MSTLEIGSRLGRALRDRLGPAGYRIPSDSLDFEICEVPAWIQLGIAGDVSRYLEKADRLLSGELNIFGLQVTAGEEAFSWNRDPLTGTVAAQEFGPKMDLHAQRVVGNIRYLWEPNRHLHLPVLAQAFCLSGCHKYLEALRKQLDSWLDQCPYPLGPNWASGLELAIRLINWSVSWQLIGMERSTLFEGSEGEAFRDRWLKSICQHIHFIRRHYSRFSSANNHLIGEAAGVFIAGCTWPYWDASSKWRDEAYHVLVREAETQIAPDGASREQSTAYQLFVSDFLILSILAARAHDLRFPSIYHERLQQSLRFLAALMDAGGHVPMIGDSDGGCVLRLSQDLDFCPYRSVFATGALLVDDSVLAAKAGHLDDRARCLTGEEGWKDLIAGDRPEEAQAALESSFSEGGYYLLGSSLGGPDECRMLVDCGPLGYLSIAAHGHADALSLYLSVMGREFLVDPGTYVYHGQDEWRAYFRGTSAHNTVTVDGLDQSVQGGKFLWTRHAKATCKTFESSPDEDHFVGEHDGYTRLRDPVVHRREIRRRGHTFEIVDALECAGRHELEQWWNFSEACRVVLDGHIVRAANDEVHIEMELDPSTEVALFRGSEDPKAGWVSRSFGVKVPAPSVRVRRTIEGATRLTTRIHA